jgi:mono/diheme cytochrome c family protein
MTRQLNLRAILASAAFAIAFAAPALAQDSAGSVGVAPVPVTGEQVYRLVCQACHMADAKGGTGAGAIPALANNPRLSVAAYPITMVVKGRGAMPWFTDTLSPAQIAAVVGYVRTNFGNRYTAPVTAADVARLAPPP